MWSKSTHQIHCPQFLGGFTSAFLDEFSWHLGCPTFPSKMVVLVRRKKAFQKWTNIAGHWNLGNYCWWPTSVWPDNMGNINMQSFAVFQSSQLFWSPFIRTWCRSEICRVNQVLLYFLGVGVKGFWKSSVRFLKEKYSQSLKILRPLTPELPWKLMNITLFLAQLSCFRCWWPKSLTFGYLADHADGVTRLGWEP